MMIELENVPTDDRVPTETVPESSPVITVSPSKPVVTVLPPEEEPVTPSPMQRLFRNPRYRFMDKSNQLPPAGQPVVAVVPPELYPVTYANKPPVSSNGDAVSCSCLVGQAFLDPLTGECSCKNGDTVVGDWTGDSVVPEQRRYTTMPVTASRKEVEVITPIGQEAPTPSGGGSVLPTGVPPLTKDTTKSTIPMRGDVLRSLPAEEVARIRRERERIAQREKSLLDLTDANLPPKSGTPVAVESSLGGAFGGIGSFVKDNFTLVLVAGVLGYFIFKDAKK